jgi:hypothetical protein
LKESFRSLGFQKDKGQDENLNDAQHFFEAAGTRPPLIQHPLNRNFPSSVIHERELQFQQPHIFPPDQVQVPPPLGSFPAQTNGVLPSSWQDEFARFQAPPSSQQNSYLSSVQQRISSMSLTSGVPFETQTWIPPLDRKTEDDAFELAFAQAESAIRPPPTIADPEEEHQKLSEAEEADLLAQTARELHDRLQHECDNDEKFKNSTFMALMKKLSNRDVIVSGNKIVENTERSHITETDIDGTWI